MTKRRKQKQLIEILKGALKRETDAFNFYSVQGSKASETEAVSLFRMLAEEESRHRLYIKQEIDKISALFTDQTEDDSELSGDTVSYTLPETVEFKRLRSLPEIDLAGVSLPLEFLGGDYLDTMVVQTKGAKNLLCLLLFDVSGHGMKASALKASVKEIMGHQQKEWYAQRENLQQIDPSLLMTRINSALTPTCQEDTRFITALNAVLDPQAGTLTYTSAGHDPPIILRRGVDYMHLDMTEIVIGAEPDKEYTSYTINVHEGDTVIFYSDGLTEAVDGSEDMFQRKGIIRAARETAKGTSHEIIESIFTALRDHMRGKNLYDDFSLLVLRCGKLGPGNRKKG